MTCLSDECAMIKLLVGMVLSVMAVHLAGDLDDDDRIPAARKDYEVIDALREHVGGLPDEGPCHVSAHVRGYCAAPCWSWHGP